ncbi:MAG: hypothetical protein LUE88_04355 [Clostridiales bacterium]|nr:hypothetical protein [Clostridiales bacterium]
MNYFEYKEYEYVKTDKDGRKVLSVGIGPEKSCIFNCAICNLDKTKYQGEWHDFGPVDDSLALLKQKIEAEKPDLVELFGKGDILTYRHLCATIDFIHAQGLPVRMITNCYLLGIDGHMELASKCEEVVAGFCFTDDETFNKIHRPVPELNFTPAKQTESMVRFSHQYNGHFTLRVLLVKGFNDTNEKAADIKKVVDQVKYDVLWVGTWPKFTVSEERIAEIDRIIRA